jgi:hypothetical protein
MAPKKTTTEKKVITQSESKENIIEKVIPEEDRIKEERKNVTANLRNTIGGEVKDEDYFFGGVVPSGFKGTCGSPVSREDLLGVFNKVFKPEDNILFYKQDDKEVYIVIVPIKYSSSIGEHNNSILGDFQKHAISFLNEGSVNLDTLKMKLTRVKNFVKFSDR